RCLAAREALGGEGAGGGRGRVGAADGGGGERARIQREERNGAEPAGEVAGRPGVDAYQRSGASRTVP
ncbi:MAG: hypothetical protein ACKO38_19465, partial [Planctomycetota bacterium]